MADDDPRLQRIFPKPSVVAYKRGKNLKDLLVRAKVCTLRKSNRKVLSPFYYKTGTIRCLGLHFSDRTVRLIEIF